MKREVTARVVMTAVQPATNIAGRNRSPRRVA
jgi:hypothetical protein